SWRDRPERGRLPREQRRLRTKLIPSSAKSCEIEGRVEARPAPPTCCALPPYFYERLQPLRQLARSSIRVGSTVFGSLGLVDLVQPVVDALQIRLHPRNSSGGARIGGDGLV